MSMAFEEMNPSCQSAWESPESFVWTEDAHSLYISFLEDAFVNDLYLGHYCSLDICGCLPPSPSTLSATAAAAESPSSAPSQHPSVVVSRHSEPEPKMETKTRRRCPRPSTGKSSSSKRKGKWPSHDAGVESLKMFEPACRLHDDKGFPQYPGSSSYSFQSSDYVVPAEVPYVVSKRARGRDKMDGIDRMGSDQVVPSDYEQG